jgi:hypothetical protein
MNTIEQIIEILKLHSDGSGIPIINGKSWDDLNQQFTKKEIKQAFAEYVSKYSVLFPFSEIKYSSVINKFNNLKKTTYSDFIMKDPGTVVEKYTDYKYPFATYGTFVISSGHYHNDISNFFQQRNRYDCGSYSFVSPNEYWYSPDLLEKMNWTFWRLDDRGISKDKILSSFRLGAYVATQFKPHVAKTIFDFTKSKTNKKLYRILDFSMGWGDRLAGFYTSKATHYFGIDPNANVYRVYKQQCIEYEKLLSGKEPVITDFQKEVKGNIYDGFKCIGASGKEVIVYNSPAEDILDIIESNAFDCIFTSPPYFATELYDEGGDDWRQSWNRYPKYDNWWEKFYKPVITSCFKSLASDGVMMINIMDPYVNSKRFNTCDQMVDHIKSIGGVFDGQIGMRIMQRPKKLESRKALKKHLENTFIENIWCFSKKGFDITNKTATLESLFGE